MNKKGGANNKVVELDGKDIEEGDIIRVIYHDDYIHPFLGDTFIGIVAWNKKGYFEIKTELAEIPIIDLYTCFDELKAKVEIVKRRGQSE